MAEDLADPVPYRFALRCPSFDLLGYLIHSPHNTKALKYVLLLERALKKRYKILLNQMDIRRKIRSEEFQEPRAKRIHKNGLNQRRGRYCVAINVLTAGWYDYNMNMERKPTRSSVKAMVIPAQLNACQIACSEIPKTALWDEKIKRTQSPFQGHRFPVSEFDPF
ncbi:hypothetical protein GB937_007280 [Aspergillus fischeri]|nr:hypothetical protein GB937_007280 [Aspergillus fischeri]